MKTCQEIGVLFVGITPIQMENVIVQFVVLITKNQYFIQINNSYQIEKFQKFKF